MKKFFNNLESEIVNTSNLALIVTTIITTFCLQIMLEGKLMFSHPEFWRAWTVLYILLGAVRSRNLSITALPRFTALNLYFIFTLVLSYLIWACFSPLFSTSHFIFGKIFFFTSLITNLVIVGCFKLMKSKEQNVLYW